MAFWFVVSLVLACVAGVVAITERAVVLTLLSLSFASFVLPFAWAVINK
jgi:hypothetical protein